MVIWSILLKLSSAYFLFKDLCVWVYMGVHARVHALWVCVHEWRSPRRLGKNIGISRARTRWCVSSDEAAGNWTLHKKYVLVSTEPSVSPWLCLIEAKIMPIHYQRPKSRRSVYMTQWHFSSITIPEDGHHWKVNFYILRHFSVLKCAMILQ